MAPLAKPTTVNFASYVVGQQDPRNSRISPTVSFDSIEISAKGCVVGGMARNRTMRETQVGRHRRVLLKGMAVAGVRQPPPVPTNGKGQPATRGATDLCPRRFEVEDRAEGAEEDHAHMIVVGGRDNDLLASLIDRVDRTCHCERGVAHLRVGMACRRVFQKERVRAHLFLRWLKTGSKYPGDGCCQVVKRLPAVVPTPVLLAVFTRHKASRCARTVLVFRSCARDIPGCPACHRLQLRSVSRCPVSRKSGSSVSPVSSLSGLVKRRRSSTSLLAIATS